MKKIALTVFVFGIMIALFIYFTPITQNDEQGEITIQVTNQLDETVINETHVFNEEDTLFSILTDNYDIGCANLQYKLSSVCEQLAFESRVILKINEVETNWLNHYISIYVDDTYSTKGIDDISLRDGSTYRFEFTVVGDDVQ